MATPMPTSNPAPVMRSEERGRGLEGLADRHIHVPVAHILHGFDQGGFEPEEPDHRHDHAEDGCCDRARLEEDRLKHGNEDPDRGSDGHETNEVGLVQLPCLLEDATRWTHGDSVCVSRSSVAVVLLPSGLSGRLSGSIRGQLVRRRRDLAILQLREMLRHR